MPSVAGDALERVLGDETVTAGIASPEIADNIVFEESRCFRFRSRHFFNLVIGKILTTRLTSSKHLAHNLGNLLLLRKIGVFHNRRNASSRLLLLISKHLILCIYLVFRILA